MPIETLNVGQEVFAKPSWQEVELALRRLNGRESDGVVLQLEGPSYMGISGGEGDKYAVIAFMDGYGEFTCASGIEGPLQDVVVSGDYNSLASRYVLNLQSALAAAKEFYERGLLSKQLKWEKSI